MKKYYIHSIIFFLLVVCFPLVPISIGEHYEQKMEETQDEAKISEWRNARLFYRLAQLAPWFWSNINERNRKIENENLQRTLGGHAATSSPRRKRYKIDIHC